MHGSNGDSDIENRLVDTGWGRGVEEGGTNGEGSMERYITICKTDSQWVFPLSLREVRLMLCINLEEWVGQEVGERFKREGTYVHLWLISC